MTTTTHDDEVTYCAVHPTRETALRCNKCERYMCIDCAMQTPVGYRCKQCVRGLEDKYFNTKSSDNIIVLVVCLVLGGVAGFLIAQMSFLLVALIAGAPAGGMISEMALRVIGRRRGRYTAHFAAVGTALGALSPLLFFLIQYRVFVPNFGVMLFAGLATAAVYARFRMRG